MPQCGPSNRTFAATAKSVDGRIHSLRTNPPFASAAIADAAFPRSCSKLFAAMLPVSPKQPFNITDLGGFQTDLSPQFVPITETRGKV
jgi:hypothetical protein